MPSTVADLLAILALETIDEGIYRGVAPETLEDEADKAFGGTDRDEAA